MGRARTYDASIVNFPVVRCRRCGTLKNINCGRDRCPLPTPEETPAIVVTQKREKPKLDELPLDGDQLYIVPKPNTKDGEVLAYIECNRIWFNTPRLVGDVIRQAVEDGKSAQTFSNNRVGRCLKIASQTGVLRKIGTATEPGRLYTNAET